MACRVSNRKNSHETTRKLNGDWGYVVRSGF